jgi:hypothetical protein
MGILLIHKFGIILPLSSLQHGVIQFPCLFVAIMCLEILKLLSVKGNLRNQI